MFCLKVEYADLYCEGRFWCDSVTNHGASYVEGVPRDEDGLKITAEKLKIVSSQSLSTVTWRKSLLMSLIIVTLALFILDARVSVWKLLVLMPVVYAVIQISFNFYKSELESRAATISNELINKLVRDNK